MSAVMPASGDGAREYFSAELRQAMERSGVKAENGSVDYLVDLILTYMKSETFFARNAEGKLADNVLYELYAEYVQGGPEKKRAALRRLGDVCLLVTGIFPDSLRRKLVDLDYYFGMGGSAYAALARIQLNNFSRGLYLELASKFIPFSNVLGEMTEKSGLQSNSDILRVYERWLLTGSERLKSLLSRHGILTPVRVDAKTKH